MNVFSGDFAAFRRSQLEKLDQRKENHSNYLDDDDIHQGISKVQEKVYSCSQCPYITTKVNGIAVHWGSFHNPNRKPRKKIKDKLKKITKGSKTQKNEIILETDCEMTVEVKEVPKILRNLKRRPVSCTEPNCRYITNKKSNLKTHKLKKHT